MPPDRLLLPRALSIMRRTLSFLTRLSSKFLFGMRREDRAAALACLDQPAILRPVLLARLGKTQRLQRVVITVVLIFLGVLIGRGCRRESPPLVIQRPVSIQSPHAHSACGHKRRDLHLRRENKERHALFAARTWSSALLAAQRREGDVAG